MDGWMQQRLVEAQAIGWKIACVRAVHGSDVNALSVEEMLAEYERMHRNILTLERAAGRTETMSELRLRLACERIT